MKILIQKVIIKFFLFQNEFFNISKGSGLKSENIKATGKFIPVKFNFIYPDLFLFITNVTTSLSKVL